MDTIRLDNTFNSYSGKLLSQASPKQIDSKTHPNFDCPEIFQKFGTLSSSGIAFVNMQNKQKVYTQEQEGKFQQLLDNGKIDKAHLELFKSIYAQKNISYEDVYKKIAKFVGIDYELPPLQTGEHIQFSSFEPITAGFSINVKFSPYPAIRHELEHLKQNVLLYRAYGKDTMIDVSFQSMIKQLEEFNPMIPEYNKMYSELTGDEIKEFRNNCKKEMESQFNTKFYENVTRQKGELTPEEKTKASLYLENAYNYDGSTGIMEDEAYAAQIDFKRMLDAFETVIK